MTRMQIGTRGKNETEPKIEHGDDFGELGPVHRHRSPELNLWAAVLARALLDLKAPKERHRREARAFLDSEHGRDLIELVRESL